MRAWSSARRSLAALALFTCLLTAAFTAAAGGSTAYAFGAGGYVAVAALALWSPAAIALQVIAGQLLLASLFVGRGVSVALLLVPAVAGVVATAELLAAVARLDTPLRDHRGHDARAPLAAAGLAALAGAAVFGAVALASPLPGPTGLLAVVLAAGACGVAARLVE